MDYQLKIYLQDMIMLHLLSVTHSIFILVRKHILNFLNDLFHGPSFDFNSWNPSFKNSIDLLNHSHSWEVFHYLVDSYHIFFIEAGRVKRRTLLNIKLFLKILSEVSFKPRWALCLFRRLGQVLRIFLNIVLFTNF